MCCDGIILAKFKATVHNGRGTLMQACLPGIHLEGSVLGLLQLQLPLCMRVRGAQACTCDEGG